MHVQLSNCLTLTWDATSRSGQRQARWPKCAANSEIWTWVYDFFIIIDSDKQTEALQIEDQIIANTSQIKLLGVEIDDKLNFTMQPYP